MAGTARITRRVRLYVLAVAVTGPLSALVAVAAAGMTLDGRGWLTASVLFALLATAHRFPLQLSQNVQVDVTTVGFLAIVLVMPLGVSGLLVYVAALASHLVRPADQTDTLEGWFNAGQLGVCTVSAAAVYDVLRRWPIGPVVGELAPLVAIVAAASVLYVVNTGLVTVVAALQMRRNPVRIFLGSIRAELRQHAVLSALGLVAALLAIEHPWALPIFGLPILLVRSAQADGVRVRAATRAALATLVDVVELSDAYTAGHSQRVADLARLLALRVGMAEEEADVVESAGRVHDLGKVAIDGAVLAKPGKLTDVERLEVERHPALGAEVIANLVAYDGVYQMVRHHHERWDGLGYPDGLRAEGIPLGARVLAVADTYDALTSDRPYRAGMSRARAHAILEDGAGTQWDPLVVVAMLTIPAQVHPRAVPASAPADRQDTASPPLAAA